MGMVGMKAQHFPIYRSQVADHQTLLMGLSFYIVICRRCYVRFHSACP